MSERQNPPMFQGNNPSDRVWIGGRDLDRTCAYGSITSEATDLITRTKDDIVDNVPISRLWELPTLVVLHDGHIDHPITNIEWIDKHEEALLMERFERSFEGVSQTYQGLQRIKSVNEQSSDNSDRHRRDGNSDLWNNTFWNDVFEGLSEKQIQFLKKERGKRRAAATRARHKAEKLTQEKQKQAEEDDFLGISPLDAE